MKLSPSAPSDPNATVYSDRDGLIPLVQPFLTSAAGKIEFYAADGRYDVYIDYEDIHYVDTDISIYDFAGLVGNTVTDVAKIIVAEAHTGLPNGIVIPNFLDHIDTPPTLPSAYDDEFNAPLGEAWTLLGDSNTQKFQTGSNAVVVQSVSSPDALIGLSRGFTPDQYFSVVAKVSLGFHPGTSGSELAGERPIFGVGIRSNSGESTVCGIRGNSQGIGICVADFDAGGLSSADTFHEIGTNEVYVRIRVKDGIFFYEWSSNGRAWITVKQCSTPFFGSAVQIGLYGHAKFSNTGFFVGASDFFRYEQTDGSIGPITYPPDYVPPIQ